MEESLRCRNLFIRFLKEQSVYYHFIDNANTNLFNKLENSVSYLNAPLKSTNKYESMNMCYNYLMTSFDWNSSEIKYIMPSSWGCINGDWVILLSEFQKTLPNFQKISKILENY